MTPESLEAIAAALTAMVERAVDDVLDGLSPEQRERVLRKPVTQEPVTQEPVTRACAHCGGEVPPPERGPVGKFCGSACKQAAYRARRARRAVSCRP